MSHASCIVALSPEEVAEHGGVDEAVAWQMEPFKENGWFSEGSRWDWWRIGGRFVGKFDPGYEPELDPENIETCSLCGGSGQREDVRLALAGEGPLPFGCRTIEDLQQWNEWAKGCNGCRGIGKAVKWPTHWRQHGVIAKRSAIGHLEGKLTAYAFLCGRRWHEAGRMGWWGCRARTECEVKAIQETGEPYTGRCLFTHEESGAKIVSFGESDENEDDDRWDRLFWPRFIRNLPPDTTLVVVDYHV